MVVVFSLYQELRAKTIRAVTIDRGEVYVPNTPTQNNQNESNWD